MAPFRLGEALGILSPVDGYPSDLAEGAITLITPWRPEWSDSQARVLAWIESEPLPPGTRLVWAVEDDCDTDRQLIAAARRLHETRNDIAIEFLDYEPEPLHGKVEMHGWISRLYTEALRSVRSEFTIFLEDDTLPPKGATAQLLGRMSALGDDAACIGLAYRSRVTPWGTCASLLERWRPIPWGDLEELEAICPVAWVGGGFTLYRTAALQCSLPFYAIVHRHIAGWDIVLCRELRSRGKRLFLCTDIRAEHRCRQVIDYCRKKNEPLA